jgi:hypothetical protein
MYGKEASIFRIKVIKVDKWVGFIGAVGTRPWRTLRTGESEPVMGKADGALGQQ